MRGIVRRRIGRKRSILGFHDLLSERYVRKKKRKEKKKNPPTLILRRSNDFEFYRIFFQLNGIKRNIIVSAKLPVLNAPNYAIDKESPVNKMKCDNELVRASETA